MTKALAFQKQDKDTLTIRIPLELSLEEAKAELDAQAVSYEEVELESLPDRTFRNSWDLVASNVVENQAKARGIHLARIRDVRDAKLQEKDKEQLKHLGDAAKLAEIEAEKQVLRDLPQNTDLSKTKSTADLLKIWPDGLDIPPVYEGKITKRIPRVV